MNVLVTGGAGYIGTVLVDMLIEEGFKVRILDNLLYNQTITENYEGVFGSVTDPRDIENAVKGVDAICHLAALANDPSCDLDPLLSDLINHQSTKFLTYAAKRNNVERFIFSSSCSVYGDKGEKSSDETSDLNPVSIYAQLKISSEEFLRNEANSKFCPTFLRNATAYGYSKGRMRFDLAVNIFTLHSLTKKKIIVFGGQQWRPIVHVKGYRQSVYQSFRSTKRTHIW